MKIKALKDEVMATCLMFSEQWECVVYLSGNIPAVFSIATT